MKIEVYIPFDGHMRIEEKMIHVVSMIYDWRAIKDVRDVYWWLNREF